MRGCRAEEVIKGSDREDVGVEIDEGGKERMKAEDVKFCQSEIEVRAA